VALDREIQSARKQSDQEGWIAVNIMLTNNSVMLWKVILTKASSSEALANFHLEIR
jgi:hypothetical protein